MLIKFENKSNRVKGLAFHPKRPWILTSLHNGTIQLWDYRMETLIDKFEEHDGPVRGVHFHKTQPLFVSGGDDYKIKVWNYQTRRCWFTLLGHLDYIRTVMFHHEYPWILSASDDQTIRIWNWQSRQCLTVLTGHNHYVMCARFHPSQDLVLSASLDQTIRVWDTSGLRKKNVSIMYEAKKEDNVNDLFGQNDVTVAHVLEGHNRGVNWASFHPKMPMIVSGADDREVKLWRMNEVKAYEVDSMRGHLNNVSCVIFHPKKELIVSNSEDKSIRVWDMNKAFSPQVFYRESDRYWILDAHAKTNLLAAGHDSGMLLFKLARERPPYDANKKELFYYKEDFVRRFDYKTGKDVPLLSTRRPLNTARSLVYNTSNRSQHCILLTSEENNSSYYELFVLNRSSKMTEDHQTFKGTGRSAVFVSRNRFAVLDRSRKVWLKDLKNETKRQISVGNAQIYQMFPGGVGRLLLRTFDGMVLFDIQVSKVQAKLPILSRHPVKYVFWSSGHKYCAMLSKANIWITNAQLEEQCFINETSRVKSGAWDPSGVFVYTTATHIKYLLPGGDSGILRTLDEPIYLTAVDGKTLWYLDREGQCLSMPVDATEYQFKVALLKRKHKEVLRIMKSGKLVGKSIISYLRNKGYPEVALHFVQDKDVKFNLALECGNIKVALECAQELDNKDYWHKLGVEALRQGNHQVVEAAYQKTMDFERLSFLYLITGNLDKLKKMLQISELRGDMMGRFHNSLYLGDVESRVKVLRDCGQTKLAYLTAASHGLEELTNELVELLGDDVPDVQSYLNGSLLQVPTPILKEQNWPLLDIRDGYWDNPPNDDDSEPEPESEEDMYDDDEEGEKKINSVDDLFGDIAPEENKAPAVPAGDQWGGGDLLGDLGLELPEDDLGADLSGLTLDAFAMPSNGKSTEATWGDNSALVADLIAAGEFDLATHKLNSTIGVVNFGPFAKYFLSIHNSVRLVAPTVFGPSSLLSYVEREGNLPRHALTHIQCIELLKVGMKAVTDGNLKGALESFKQLLLMIPLITVGKRSEETKLAEMVQVARRYITALRVELARREETDPKKQCALAAYFTRCNLQPLHVILGLKIAIKAAFGLQNFKMASEFCRRILELCQSSNKAELQAVVNPQQIRGVLKHCEAKNSDAVPLDYKDGIHFDLCCQSLTPVWKGDASTSCPYCKSVYKTQFDLTLCSTCGVSRVGREASGLSVYQEPRGGSAF